jgi:hypothetical protein
VDGVQIGLGGGAGMPLPDGVRRKMESALRADFSSVRVHIGPQAERIGALAFTMGSDIYFAPGRFQPTSIPGQQLLGHELAHVIQQRRGRVPNPWDDGIAVVQDQTLEAEAERLGHCAAAHQLPVQPKMAGGNPRVSNPVASLPAQNRVAQPGTASYPQSAIGVRKAHYLVVQLMKRDKNNNNDDSDEDYEDPSERQKERRPATMSHKLAREVIEKTGHEKKKSKLDPSYEAVWTCRACGRPLMYKKNGQYYLTQYSYTSRKKKHLKTQRSTEPDHVPTYAKRKSGIYKGYTEDQIKQDYLDTDKLQALCRVCNGSHDYEGEWVSDYDSDDSSGPGSPRTPPREPENKGNFSFYSTGADPGGIHVK